MRHAMVAMMLAVIASDAAAQNPRPDVDTVTVTQRVVVAGDVTPSDAKRQALEKALAEAVRRVSGVRVQSTQLGVDDDRNGRAHGSFTSVVQLDADGRATDYRILDERFESSRHPSLGAQLYFELRALVTVARERGQADPGFTVSVSLNDALFFDAGGRVEQNDEVIATVTSSHDAWLTVFSVTGDSAELLLPNVVMRDRTVRRAVATELPSRDWRDRGVHFRASLGANERARRELLVVVATRSDLSFSPATAGAGASGSFPLMAIQRWLVSIPLEQRAIAFAPYEVRRRDPGRPPPP